MKKNRLFKFRSLILVILAVFTLNSLNAQEAKEEKKVIKIITITEEDGNVTSDTIIVLDDDFDGDWKSLIEDEGEVKVMVEQIKVDSDIEVITIDGDTTIKLMVMSAGSGHDGDNNVMVWTSDGEEEMSHDIMLKKMDGDSTIVIVTSLSGAEHAKAHSSGKVIMKTVEIETDENGNIVKKVIVSDGEDMHFGGKDFEVIELKDHDGAMIFVSMIMISDADETEMEMLKEAGAKMGKDPLILKDLKVGQGPHNHNLKIEFTAHDLNNLSIALMDENGKQLFLEELKTFNGKYIREIEVPKDAKGDFFLHIISGRESVTKKINLK